MLSTQSVPFSYINAKRCLSATMIKYKDASIINKYTLSIPVPIKTGDRCKKYLGKSLRLTVGAKNYNDKVSFNKYITNRVQLADTFYRVSLQQSYSMVNISSQYKLLVAKRVIEPVATSEHSEDKFDINKSINDRLFLKDGVKHSIASSLKGKIYTKSKVISALTKNLFSRVLSVDDERDIFIIDRTINEPVIVKSHVQKDLVKYCKLTASLTPVAVPPVLLGVISDIGILKECISEKEYTVALNKGSACGFTNWQDFHVGETYFREMLLRVMVNITAPELVNDVRLTRHKVICDVEDVIETRTISVPAKPITVIFNKKFRVIPDVSVTSHVTPEVAVVQIISVEIDKFTVQLCKPDGSHTNGQITFHAIGY